MRFCHISLGPQVCLLLFILHHLCRVLIVPAFLMPVFLEEVKYTHMVCCYCIVLCKWNKPDVRNRNTDNALFRKLLVAKLKTSWNKQFVSYVKKIKWYMWYRVIIGKNRE